MTLANARPRRFNRDEYYRMAENGLFARSERVELIDGEIVTMPAQNLRHANATGSSNKLLITRFSDTHIVRCQSPLTLTDDCEPEPDFALVTPEHLRDSNAAGRHPSRPDLVVEVSDSSMRYDRAEKVGLYARAGIPEYWILNVARRCLEERRDPGPDPDAPLGFSYRSIRLVPEGGSVSPLFAPERCVLVSDLLGPPVD